MIYIDPPYNTGNDSFIYPDKFSESKEEYQKRIGDKDEEGYMTREGMFHKNSKDNGQYHSNWLNMMYPRLYLATNLLSEEGLIFISIDDNEVHNLRLLMNEIYGEENFIAQFVWKSRQNKDNRNVTGASIDHEYVICYGHKIRGSERNLNQYQNPDDDPRGKWTSANMVGILPADRRPNCHYDLVNSKTGINYGKPMMGWRYDKKTMQRLIEEDRIIWPETPNGRPRRKVFLEELKDKYTGYSSIIGTNIYTKDGTNEIEEIFGFRAFDFPKPTSLIKELMMQGLDDDGIILDFFAGSAPTAQAVFDLNHSDGLKRNFICVQLPEHCDRNSEVFKKGYNTVADIGKERIRRIIKQINEEVQNGKLDFGDDIQDLGFKVFKLAESNFKQWQQREITDSNQLEENMKLFVDPMRKGSSVKEMVYELLLKSGKDLNSKIEHINNYYVVNENELALMLEEANQSIVEEIIGLKPQKIIALDKLFEGNDQLKTNTVLQMKDAEIDFKTI